MDKISIRSNFLLVVSLLCTMLIISCLSDQENSESSDSDLEFQFEVVDSLLLDYLGTPKLCDFSPNREHILFYNSRNSEFIIADTNGSILNQFSKEGDIPDNPGSLSDRPIFFDDETIIAHGQDGIWAYNFDGGNVWSIKRDEPISYWFSKSYGRSIYLLDPPHYFTVINYDLLALDASQDSLYENQHALKLINRKTESLESIIPLEPFSRYLDGKGYKPASMLPINHVNGETMVISYAKDEIVYLYDWADERFQLADTFSLNIEPFFLDEAEKRESFKDQEGFMFGGKIGEAEVRGSWLLNNDMVLVQYNAGVKESERQEAKMESVGENSVRLIMPDNIPADKFQLYQDGRKYGASFTKMEALANLLYVQNDSYWFGKDIETLGIEDDYAVFYKAKLVQNN